MTKADAVPKGASLEDTIELVLDALNAVVEDYKLLRARHYPDFWVRDSKGREYLIECKNIVPGVIPNPRHFSDDGRWTEEYLWTERNILSKAWNLPQYETRPEPGKKHGQWVLVNSPKPVLIIRHCNFDLPSLAALQRLFQDRIIAYGSRTYQPRYSFVIERLRKIFDSK